MIQPLLSVCIITYNHEEYIRDAIEGVLMQKVNFNYEIIIADDYSTDNTRKILLEYKEKYPKFFKLILQEKNVGAAQNWLDLISTPKSKYIAYFEGDDYWTDPLKLQKQVDFLEANAEYGLVCTNYTSDLITTAIDNSKDIYLKDILKDSAVGTVTTMFKNSILQQHLLNTANLQLSMGDFPLWIHISSMQKVYKLSDTTAHYRILENSASARNDVVKRIKFALDVLTVVKENLNKIEDKKNQNAILQERYGQLFNLLMEAKDRRFMKYQWEYFKLARVFNSLDAKILIKGIYRVYVS